MRKSRFSEEQIIQAIKRVDAGVLRAAGWNAARRASVRVEP